MPENDVCLDAKLLQVQDPLLELLPKRRIRLVEIKLAVRPPL